MSDRDFRSNVLTALILIWIAVLGFGLIFLAAWHNHAAEQSRFYDFAQRQMEYDTCVASVSREQGEPPWRVRVQDECGSEPSR